MYHAGAVAGPLLAAAPVAHVAVRAPADRAGAVPTGQVAVPTGQVAVPTGQGAVPTGRASGGVAAG
ncbi:hypothetical protein [Streptomyces sp. NPDC057363]|uniref:hypothetical protein n=1 Tax=Streptomyces sp. NPDC057363 TaxID=3346107 RepID=UPI00363FCEE1